MNDYELGYEHGYNRGRSRPGVNKYPNNANYTEGFRDGNYARCRMPEYREPDYLGANDTTPD